MTRDIETRLEQMSDAILQRPSTEWLGASLLLWEAAQAIKALRAKEEIYVSNVHSPDE
jgi:hypothetical protein